VVNGSEDVKRLYEHHVEFGEVKETKGGRERK
jgi:hypothetical protein